MSRPLTIGQVCLGILGGSSRMAHRLAQALSRRDHEVHLFSGEPLPWPTDQAVEQHVCRTAAPDLQAPPYWHWTETDRISFSRLLADEIETRHFDVLHYHYAQPFAGLMADVAAVAGERMPLVVGTLHGTDLTRPLGDPEALSRLSRELAATDALTTVSRHMGRLATALAETVPPPWVLPNFVEDDWGRPGAMDVATPVTRPTILHVSNFRAVKDVGLLVRLYLAIHERTGAALCLVGDGPEMPVIRQRLDASAAAAAVRYIGASPCPEDYFDNATLLLSTSVEESFGLVMLEAMAAGLPVAATAVGGIPELIEDGVNGLLFNAADVEPTVERIVSVLRSAEKLTELRQGGRARAEALRESPVIGVYEDFYRAQLARCRGMGG